MQKATDIPQRDAEQVKIYKKIGMDYGEVIFAYDGLKIITDGYEAPYIKVRIGEHEVCMETEAARLLYRAMLDALKWCEEGWCPGAC